uniref:EB domain-containing protein n=1 Tax=Parascaris equorum TaxID=6256 RepID=A0A914RGS8_PAREQ
STCASGFCVCAEGELIINDECVGSQNKETSCIGGSICLASMCTCPEGTRLIYGECIAQTTTLSVEYTTAANVAERRMVGSLCRGNCDPLKGLDCVGESYCIYGMCVCIGGLVNTGYECASAVSRKTANPGQSCAEGQICTGGSKC